jgi:MFS family permease
MASADSASERTPLLVEDVENDHSSSSTYDSIAELPSGGDHDNGANKEHPTPLPKLQIFLISFIQIAEPIIATVIFPFVVQLIRDTGVTGGDEAKTGYYAGFIVCYFFLSRATTVLMYY